MGFVSVHGLRGCGKGETGGKMSENIPQGLKAALVLLGLMYGLKSVPFKTGVLPQLL
jgi:hypothetical protein